MAEQKKIFVSWTSADENKIKKYIKMIEQKTGLSYFFSENHCIGDFEVWFEDAIKNAPFFIAYITEQSLNKKFCKKEIELAIEKYKKYDYKFITFISDIPVEKINQLDHTHHIYRLINECKVSGVFTNNIDFEEVINQITSKFNEMRACYDLFLYKNSLDEKLKQCSILGEAARTTIDEFYVEREIVNENNEIVSIENILDNGKILIRGVAGAGKTIFIKKLAININSNDNYIFILESSDVKDILKNNLSIISYLYKKCNCHLLSFDEFSSIMQNKINYLAVEGLDEVIGNNKELLLKKVLDFSNDYKDFKIMFTSRNDENIKGIVKFEIKKLNQDCINNVAANFIRLYGKDKEKEFFIALESINDELKNNPLLLTQLAYIYSKKNYLPNNLYDLYTIVSDLIIKQTNENNIEVSLNNSIEYFISNNKKILSKCAFLLIKNRDDNTYSFKKALDLCVDNDVTNEIYNYLIARSIVVNDEFYHKTLLEYYACLYIFEQCYEDDLIDGYIPNDKLKSLVTTCNLADLYEILLLQIDYKCQEKGIEKSIDILLNNQTIEYFPILNVVTKKNIFGKNLLRSLFNDACNRISHPFHELLFYTVTNNLYEELLLLAKEISDNFNYVYSFVSDILILYSNIDIFNYKSLYIDNINKCINDGTKRYNHLINYFTKGIIDYDFYYKKDDYDINVINNDKLIGHIIVKSQKELIGKITRNIIGLSVLDEKNFYKDIDSYYKNNICVLIVPYKLNTLESFSLFKSLNKIIFTKNITSIGEYAFYNCIFLTSIIIPCSVISIGKSAFENCDSLTIYSEVNFELDEWEYSWNVERPVYYGVTKEDVIVQNGIHYLIIDDDAVITRYIGNDSNLDIPDSIIVDGTIRRVSSIGSHAFSCCNYLINIIIPNCITSIEEYAFSGCDSLKTVKFGINSQLKILGDFVFYNCKSLVDIIIPNSLTSIGHEVFYICNSLTNVYYDGTIDNWCKLKFGYHSNPMYYASHFYMKNENNEYKEVTSIEIPDTITSIGNYQFCGFNNVTLIVIPSCISSIGKGAFLDCDSLTNIIIPSSVISIDHSAFSGCSSLENVYYEGTIENWCKISFSDESANPMYYASHFYMKDENDEYKEVTSIEIPDIIISIGEYQFCGFNNVTLIVIPSCIFSIGKGAFLDCDSLTNIIIPSSVISIDHSAFSGCGSLVNIYYDGTIEDWCKITFDYNVYSYIQGGNTMTTTLHFFMKDENNEYKEVTSIEIPETISCIGNYQFLRFNNVESVIIPNSVTKIGSFAFCGCSSLTNIVIPKSITLICDNAFYGCNSLILHCEDNSKPKGWSNNWNKLTKDEVIEYNNIRYLITDDNAVIVKYIGNDNNVVIPEFIEVNGITYNVISIGERAFENCKYLTNIMLPNSITSIGNSAFSGCNSFKSIVIPSSVTSIGDYVFEYCDSLTIYCESNYQPIGLKIYCDSPIYLGVTKDNVIEQDGIQYLIIDEHAVLTRYIGNDNIVNIPKLLEINNLAYKITQIGNYAFSNYISLTNIHISSSVISIKACAFYGCSFLKTIDIPSSVANIEEYAFANCTNLKHLKIPENYIDEIPSLFDDENNTILEQYYKKNYVIKDGYLIIDANDSDN